MVEERSADKGPSLSERGAGGMALARGTPHKKALHFRPSFVPAYHRFSREIRFRATPNLAVGRRERYVVLVCCWLAEMACCEYV